MILLRSQDVISKAPSAVASSRTLYCFFVSSIFTLWIMMEEKTAAQLLTPQSASGGINQPNLADSPYAFSELFTPQAQLLHQSLSTLGKTGQQGTLTCDGIAQEYCVKPGQFYPRGEIGFFIDENRSMMKRMFGSVSARSLLRKDEEEAAVDNSDLRRRRQAKPPQPPSVYLCPVEEELVTPFWAVNGTGVRLAIVNTPPFEQAIHTVKCARGQTGRCHPTRPCWCTQEYSWFRLLAYDATDNCKGIFMDWFKFPSHCACKCVQAAAANADGGAAGTAVTIAPLAIN